MAISPAVATLRNTPVFEVPDGYFETFASQIVSVVKHAEKDLPVSEEWKFLAPRLAEPGKKMPFELEADYFEKLPSEIMLQLQSDNSISSKDELKNLSPLLSSIGNKHPFDLPKGYFEKLSPLPKNVEKEEVKVVSIGRRTRWINLAAAALVTGFVGISAWLVFLNPQMKNDTITLSPVAKEISQISDSEMVKFLENFGSPIQAPIDEQSLADLNDTEAEDLFGDLPDSELSKYLKENPVVPSEELKLN